MTSDVLYGRVAFRPYFDMHRFEDNIYNRVNMREKRISIKKRLRIVDRLLVIAIAFLFTILFVVLSAIIYRNISINSKDNYIKKLEKTLDRKIYDNKNVVSSLKSEMKFDDIKMKAYMDLNMITPTEKNIIHFKKSDNGFVRQYENIR